MSAAVVSLWIWHGPQRSLCRDAFYEQETEPVGTGTDTGTGTGTGRHMNATMLSGASLKWMLGLPFLGIYLGTVAAQLHNRTATTAPTLKSYLPADSLIASFVSSCPVNHWMGGWTHAARDNHLCLPGNFPSSHHRRAMIDSARRKTES